MRTAILVLGLVVGVATLTGGCATARLGPVLSGSASDDGSGSRPSAPTAAPLPDPGAMAANRVVPCDAPMACPCPPQCGLPCERGQGGWNLRALGGLAFWGGTDAADDCSYFGADVGHSFCGSCWSLGGFWRTHTARFDRDPAGEDGGTWNHVGLKLSYERSLGGGRWYVWGGVGPEYFWTTDYLDDDSGFGVFGEAGLGYVVNRHWRILAGVNVHGMSTDVGRRSPADDGESRWLWIVAPVVGIQFDF